MYITNKSYSTGMVWVSQSSVNVQKKQERTVSTCKACPFPNRISISIIKTFYQTLTSPLRDATYSVPARDVVSNRFVALGDGMSSPGFMIAHLIWFRESCTHGNVVCIVPVQQCMVHSVVLLHSAGQLPQVGPTRNKCQNDCPSVRV